jgi:hypothetical protein
MTIYFCEAKHNDIHEDENGVEGLERAVAREVIHTVLVGEGSRPDQPSGNLGAHQGPGVRFGHLRRVKRTVTGTRRHIGDNLLREVVASTCIDRNRGGKRAEV